MWKCKYCDKTNFDDQKICPYCNAPNPAQPPQSDPKQAPLDWEKRYNTDNRVKNNRTKKLDVVLKYMVIGAAALLMIFLVTVMIQKRAESKTVSSGAQAAAANALELDELGEEMATPVVVETPAPTATPKPTPEPTKAPVFVNANSDLYLGFGDIYHCTPSDFDLPYEIRLDEISWSCEENYVGTTCSKSGRIVAGNIQADPERKFNDMIKITGTTKNGSKLIYHLYTGSGKTYLFDWSTSSRSMRGYISGYVIVSDEMIVQCNGFSIYYEYELTRGKLEANSWSVWVREDGTTWVRVQDIQLENRVGDVFDITFDRPITFNEIWVMPETYSMDYSVTTTFQVGYLIFES
ncbi:MAG: hypothetical protein R2912_09695 [Eubacteriales bacterium]